MAASPLLWSVIIPTMNRADSLNMTLRALSKQSLHPLMYEILVVNNGSTDHTAAVVNECMQDFPSRQIRFLEAGPPGLLTGRHKGAMESKGQVLTFVDDDIDVEADYGASIVTAFRDGNVCLVGGPCRPRYACETPPWLEHYCQRSPGRFVCGALSLYDFGNTPQTMSPGQVWGLNYSIRRETLWECGGFHPDNVPQSLLMFRGDGESGLNAKLERRGMVAHYVPGAAVTHVIPDSRLTEAYFCHRYFYQAVCESYTEIRAKGHTEGLHIPAPMRVEHGSPEAVHQRIRNAYVDGYLFHQNAVKQSPALLQWVLKKDYWDYDYPELEEGLVLQREWAERLLHNPLNILSHAGEVLSLALDFARRGDIAAALSLVNKTERQHSATAETKVTRCLILAQSGRGEEAAQAAREALELDSTCEVALTYLQQVQAATNGNLTQIYDVDFYTADADLSLQSARRVLPHVMDLLAPQSVQDFGCGQGDWLAVFGELGVQQRQGYDANALDTSDLLIPQSVVQQNCDFASTAFRPQMKTDLAMSVEVAEHLPHDAAKNFVNILTAAAPCVLFSAALPCQTGVQHINERSPRYWHALFEQRGFVLFDIIRPLIWHETSIGWWYRQNIVLYVHHGHLQRNPSLAQKLSHMPSMRDMTYVETGNLERLCKSHHAMQRIDAALAAYISGSDKGLLEHIVAALEDCGDPQSMQALQILRMRSTA